MDFKIVLIIIVVVVAFAIYYKPLGSLWFIKKGCSATAPGTFVYWEGAYRANQPGTGVITMIPVYEYKVDDKVYLAMIEGMEQAYEVFPLNVDVKYNPVNPEVCFINGKRGTILKGK